MKERPIIMSAESVRAILDGGKTQTRRVVNFRTRYDNPNDWSESSAHQTGDGSWIFWDCMVDDEITKRAYPKGGGYKCPYGNVGDRLWVRETFMLESWTREFGDVPPLPTDRPHKFFHDEDCGDRWEWAHYAATDPKPELVNMNTAEMLGWKSPRYMPRWASRITLEIVSVRVERVRNICGEDALAEGYRANPHIKHRTFEETRNNMPMRPFTAVDGFHGEWDKLNDKRGYGWDKNPWVWVIEFKKGTP